MNKSAKPVLPFTRYQVFIIAILALLQFTVVLDFMVISPLGAILIDSLNVSTSGFGLVVSGYAFSAGISGFLAAGFADRFDRKKLLLFFYAGFMIGTVLCAVANSYEFLLIARIVTGLFGGVISSIGLAIITDLFRLELRGRVMGFVQMAFSVSQVLGIPVGLVLANRWNWHAPFWMIAALGTLLGVIILIYMKPVTAHLHKQRRQNPFVHLIRTLRQREYLLAFLATAMLMTGGFMLMPFSSTFTVNNLGVSLEKLPVLYSITGVFTIICGPLIGIMSDRIGKYKMFVAGSVLSMIMVAVYTNLGVTPLLQVISVSVVFFIGISSRMISASALMTAVPGQEDRGAFMSLYASVQQLSGGLASVIAGMIIVKGYKDRLLHFNTLGYIVIGSMLVAILLLYFVNRQIQQKARSAEQDTAPVAVPAEG